MGKILKLMQEETQMLNLFTLVIYDQHKNPVEKIKEIEQIIFEYKILRCIGDTSE